MIRILITVVLAGLIAFLFPVHAKADLTGGIEFSQDSDDADMYSFYAGYSHPLKGQEPEPVIGFKVGLLTYRDPVGTERFRLLELTHKSAPFRKAHLDLKGRWLRSDWSPFLYSGNFSYRPTDKWYFELFGERGIVDTVTSIQLEYFIETKGFSVDYSLTKAFTLVAALFDQDISDGNDRTGKIGKVIYTPPSHENLNFQIKARIINNDFEGNGYFSPETLSEYFFLIGFTRPFANDNWVFKSLAGPGIQKVEDFTGESERKSAVLMEASLKGWFTQELGLNGKLGYTTAQRTSDSNSFVYGEVNFVYAW